MGGVPVSTLSLENTADSKTPVKTLFSFKLPKALCLLFQTQSNVVKELFLNSWFQAVWISFSHLQPLWIFSSGSRGCIKPSTQTFPPAQGGQQLFLCSIMNDRGRFIEQRGEGLHVHPEFSHCTAASWMGNAKAEVLNGAPALQTPSGSLFQHSDAKPYGIQMKEGEQKNKFKKKGRTD